MKFTPTTPALLDFYAEHPSLAPTDPARGHAVSFPTLALFFRWLVATDRQPRDLVEVAYMAYRRKSPADFPLPFPWGSA